MKFKVTPAKGRALAIACVETLLITALSLYVITGLGIFVKHHCWDALTTAQREQILEQMSRSAQEPTLFN